MVKTVTYSQDRKLTGVDNKGRPLPARVAGTYRIVGPTCPATCRFLPTPENAASAKTEGRKLCYAPRGRTRFAEQKATWDENDGETIKNFVANELSRSHSIRHHISGDLGRPGGVLDESYIDGIVEGHRLNPAVSGWLYTHYWRDLSPCRFKVGRLTANASTDSLKDAAEAKRRGWDTVVVLDPKETRRRFRHREGDVELDIVVCPAQQTKNKIGCTSCRICFQRDRKLTVGFLEH